MNMDEPQIYVTVNNNNTSFCNGQELEAFIPPNCAHQSNTHPFSAVRMTSLSQIGGDVTNTPIIKAMQNEEPLYSSPKSEVPAPELDSMKITLKEKLKNKVLDDMYKGLNSTEFCSCPSELEHREEVPDDQVFIDNGQMCRLQDVAVIKIGNLQFHAFLKNGLLFVPKPLILGQLSRERQSQFKAAMWRFRRLKVIDMGDYDIQLMKQKYDIFLPHRMKTMVDLYSIRMLSKTLNSRYKDPVLDVLANEPVLLKTNFCNVRCSECRLKVEKPDDADQFLDLDFDTFKGESRPSKSEQVQVELTIGEVTVQDTKFAAFQMQEKIYISMKEFVLFGVLRLGSLQSKLEALRCRPIVPPPEVVRIYEDSDMSVSRSLWIDVDILGTVCKQTYTQYSTRHDLLVHFTMKSYFYTANLMLVGTNTSELEDKYVVDYENVEIVSKINGPPSGIAFDIVNNPNPHIRTKRRFDSSTISSIKCDYPTQKSSYSVLDICDTEQSELVSSEKGQSKEETKRPLEKPSHVERSINPEKMLFLSGEEYIIEDVESFRQAVLDGNVHYCDKDDLMTILTLKPWDPPSNWGNTDNTEQRIACCMTTAEGHLDTGECDTNTCMDSSIEPTPSDVRIPDASKASGILTNEGDNLSTSQDTLIHNQCPTTADNLNVTVQTQPVSRPSEESGIPTNEGDNLSTSQDTLIHNQCPTTADKLNVTVQTQPVSRPSEESGILTNEGDNLSTSQDTLIHNQCPTTADKLNVTVQTQPVSRPSEESGIPTNEGDNLSTSQDTLIHNQCPTTADNLNVTIQTQPVSRPSEESGIPTNKRDNLSTSQDTLERNQCPTTADKMNMTVQRQPVSRPSKALGILTNKGDNLSTSQDTLERNQCPTTADKMNMTVQRQPVSRPSKASGILTNKGDNLSTSQDTLKRDQCPTTADKINMTVQRQPVLRPSEEYACSNDAGIQSDPTSSRHTNTIVKNSMIKMLLARAPNVKSPSNDQFISNKSAMIQGPSSEIQCVSNVVNETSGVKTNFDTMKDTVNETLSPVNEKQIECNLDKADSTEDNYSITCNKNSPIKSVPSHVDKIYSRIESMIQSNTFNDNVSPLNMLATIATTEDKQIETKRDAEGTGTKANENTKVELKHLEYTEEAKRTAEKNIKEFVVFAPYGSGIRVKRFKEGAEKAFPALFAPYPNHPTAKKRRKNFMISVSRWMISKFSKRGPNIEKRGTSNIETKDQQDEHPGEKKRGNTEIGITGAKTDAKSKDKHSKTKSQTTDEQLVDKDKHDKEAVEASINNEGEGVNIACETSVNGSDAKSKQSVSQNKTTSGNTENERIEEIIGDSPNKDNNEEKYVVSINKSNTEDGVSENQTKDDVDLITMDQTDSERSSVCIQESSPFDSITGSISDIFDTDEYESSDNNGRYRKRNMEDSLKRKALENICSVKLKRMKILENLFDIE